MKSIFIPAALIFRVIIAAACLFSLPAASESTTEKNTGESQPQKPDTHADHPHSKHIEHVLISVPRQTSTAETALSITVLSDDELRNQVANTIGETLNNKPCLDSSSFGPGVGLPVIRGQQGARVSVLQNSLRSADASTVSADHAVSAEPILAQSIEVLRGPSTLLYGGGAIGGVVNIIDNRIPSKAPEKLNATAEIRHGSVNDETTAVVAIDGGSGNFAFHFDAMEHETNNMDIPGFAAHEHEGEEESTYGFIDNTSSETDSYTFGSSYLLDNSYISLSVNRLENDYGIPAGAHEGHDHEEDHEEGEHEEHEEEHEGHNESIRIQVEQTRYDFRTELNNLSDSIESLRWFVAYTDYEHIELESNEIGTIVGTTWERENIESRLEILHNPWNRWKGAIGVQLQQSELKAEGEESYIPKTEVANYGLFAVESFTAGDLTWELGARVDRSERDPSNAGSDESFNALSLSASTLWHINDMWHLGVALSQSERAPVTEELYSNVENSFGDYVEHIATGTIEVGDNNLDNEQSNNIDLTLNFQGHKAEGYVTLYHNSFDGYIYLADSGLEQDEIHVLNYSQQDASFKGIEFEVATPLGNALGGEFSLKLFGDWMEGKLDSTSPSEKYVPRLPPMRLGSRLNFESESMSLFVSFLNAADQDDIGFNEEETEGYTRWDAGVNYRLNLNPNQKATAFLRLKNISDEEIRNSTSFLKEIAPEAGRSIEAGIRFHF